MSGGAPDLDTFRAALLTREVGRAVEWHVTVTSTNDVALESLARGAPHGLVVGAEEQTAGRGRSGRDWVAPHGKALLVSVVLAGRGEAPAAGPVTLAAATAVCETLRDGGVEGAHIKWPNDVLVGDRKVAGILCESRVRDGRVEGIVVGIGLNVNQEEDELPPGATSIGLECGAPADRAVVLAELLNRLERWWALAASGRFDRVREAWESMSRLHRGHAVRVEEGGRSWEGVSAGIEEDGRLRVRRADGTVEPVVSAGVRFGGPA